jgi:dienelactone hydrolase
VKVGPRVLTLIAAAAFGVAITGGDTLGAGGIESLKFQSGSYTNFRQVLMGEAATAVVTVSATLSFPNEARDRYPAVVVVHTIGGYQEANEGWYAAELRKAGFATLTYDSFAARGLSEAAILASDAGPPFVSAVADAYAALRLLAGHPKIDASRIAIVGFSFGGEIAHLTAFERLRTALVPGRLRFAAHVAYYPAGVYGAAAEQGAYTGAPILMLLGERDDNLPVAKAEEYLGYSEGIRLPSKC